MKILVDMNLSPQWRAVLEKHEFTCRHWSEVGKPDASDKEIMQWALKNGYALFTHDLDFGAILAATQASGPSVIQVRAPDVLPSAIESVVVRIFQEFSREIEIGALISVDSALSRVRILPLKR